MINFGNREINSRANVGQFNFRGGNQQKKFGVLSGSERNRVHLARIIKECASKVVWFEGNFSDYEENKRERLGSAADIPHRIKYKKLVR